MPTFDELTAPLRAEFDSQAQALANRDQAIADLNAELDAANTRIVELEAGNPPPPPPPPPTVRKVTYGACPDNAHTGNAASVIDKYGTGASVRWFSNGLGVPVRPDGCSLMHCSWKPSLTTVITPALVEKLCANLLPGDIVEVWHEIDVKHKKAAKKNPAQAYDDLDQMIRLKAELHATIGQVRPDLYTANTLAGWRFHPNGDTPDLYYAPAHVAGVDLDGAPGPVDWVGCVPNVQAWADEHYDGQWTVGEYAWDRTVTNRLELIRKQTPVIAAAGPVSIMWFDYDGGQLNDAEIADWRGRVTA